MNYKLSTVATLVCVSVLGMTGCNSSNNNTFRGVDDFNTDGTQGGEDELTSTLLPVSTDDDVCQIPSVLKQSITLDQNKTKIALQTAVISGKIAYSLSDDSYSFVAPKQVATAKEIQEVSKLTEMFTARIKILQDTTSAGNQTIKAYAEDTLIYDEETACDTGTYFASYSTEEDLELETTNETLTLNFKDCVLEDNYNNGELVYIFNRNISATSTLNKVLIESTHREYTYDGTLTLERYEKDLEGSPYERTSHLITEELSREYKENNSTKEIFNSTEDVQITLTSSSESNTSEEYESEAAFAEGNYTRITLEKESTTYAVIFEGSESYQVYSDINSSEHLSASCYSANITYDFDDKSTSEYREHQQKNSIYEQYSYNESITSSGYLVFNEEVGKDKSFLDFYSDKFTVKSTEEYFNTGEFISRKSLNGSIASLLLGGSVKFDTENTWRMNTAYPDNRLSLLLAPTSISAGYTSYLHYSPYSGKTILTSSNTAIVQFKFEEIDSHPYTYGEITIENEESVEYDSIEEMIESVELYGHF